MTVRDYLAASHGLIADLLHDPITETIGVLERIRRNQGRVFVIGNGGGAAHASHFAADLRKMAHIQAYAWGDNTSDVTAYINDVSWEASIARWLEDSHYDKFDALFVFSVGGASDSVSANLKWAMSTAKGTTILGIVGSGGGEFERYATTCIKLPTNDTCQVEGLQSVVAHCLVRCLS